MDKKLIYDVLGIGFGPSNLSVAIAIEERSSIAHLKAIFLEQKETFSWHPNMLLENAEMQISFLKDLVTLRNPSSPYTFLNYLKSVGRLSAFANLRHFYPSRVEFNDYLAWVANKLNDYAVYGQRVISITPYEVEPHSLIEVVSEEVVSGEKQHYLARNIIVAPGGTPSLPFPLDIQKKSERVWHSSQYLSKINLYKDVKTKPYRFAVIGRGQSAAEICRDLHTNYPNSTVTCIYRGFGLKPADDSEFVNEVFDSKFVDFLYATSPEVQEQLLTEHYDTNYSVVDSELIRQLYKIYYEEKVVGSRRLKFKNLSKVLKITEQDGLVKIDTIGVSSGVLESMNVDLAILATGYNYPNPPKILSSLVPYLNTNTVTGSAFVNRHYRVETKPNLKAGVYVQGCNETTHGLSDTLLSILPIRAEEILTHIMGSTEALTTKHIQKNNYKSAEKVLAL